MRVVVTRPEAQAEALIDALVRTGATVVALPLIAAEPITTSPEITGACAHIDRYDVVVVTSANGVECLVDRLAESGARMPVSTRICAVGDATARAASRRGLRIEVLPQRASGAAIVEALGPSVSGARVLCARARDARPELPEGLRAAGAQVDDVAFYVTVDVTPTPDAVATAFPADVVVLTAPSAVRNALLVIGRQHLSATRIVTIGPTTSAAVRDAGLDVAAEADDQSVDGLVTAVADVFPGR